MKTKLFLTAIALFSLVAFSSAQSRGGNCNGQGYNRCGQGQQGQGRNQQSSYIDNNNNQVCDNFENGTRQPKQKAYKKGNGNGNKTANRQRKADGTGPNHNAITNE